ncbi:MAG: hypothetical protein MZV64_13155 [Ignavibacteriales bacterium]|nr:hypothetical protein [Ignavibacteriales bacterium]
MTAERMADPREALKELRTYAANRGFDPLIVDTAGRLHVDDELMDELRLVRDILDPVEVDLRRRRHDRPGRRAQRPGLRGEDRPDRRRPDQARRRRPGRGGPVHRLGDRPAHQVHRRRREVRQARGLPPRAHGLPHPGPGRHPVACREGPGRGRPRRGRGDGPQAPQAGVHPGGFPEADRPDEEDGLDGRPPRPPAPGRAAQGIGQGPDRRAPGHPLRGHHQLDDPGRAGRPADPQRQPPGPHRPGQRPPGPRDQPAGEAVPGNEEDDEELVGPQAPRRPEIRFFSRSGESLSTAFLRGRASTHSSQKAA